MNDKKIQEAVKREARRQLYNIELITSENYVSKGVLEAVGSILTNKYAEGYPSKRHHGGCVHVDEIEEIVRERMKQLSSAEYANVQPHSGLQVNMGVYLSILQPGDTVLGINLTAGGHPAHGHPLNFSGTLYRFVDYGATKDSETINYEEVRRVALKEQPKLIVAGASTYPRVIDFARSREIADEVGTYLMVNMAYIAGLVAAGEHPGPVPYADSVTTTTHRTLRGPRGGLILCKKEHATLLDKKVFPGMQGGPLMHTIAAKAVCMQEAIQPEFKEYVKQIIANCTVMSNTLKEEGFCIISGGTDNRLILVDVESSLNMSGKLAEKPLDEAGITCNKNTILFEIEKPFVTSGIRLGTAAMTTRGFKENGSRQVALWISRVLKNARDEAVREEVCKGVHALTVQFSLPNERQENMQWERTSICSHFNRDKTSAWEFASTRISIINLQIAHNRVGYVHKEESIRILYVIRWRVEKRMKKEFSIAQKKPN